MSEKLKYKKNEWVHLADLNEDNLAYLKRLKFKDLDIESVATPLQRSKVEIYKNYIYLVINLPLLTEAGEVKNRRLDIFVSRTKIVTLTKKPIPALSSFWQDLNKKNALKTKCLSNTNLGLYHILKRLMVEAKLVNQKIGSELNNLNKELIKHGPRQTITRVFLARRSTIYFLTLLKPLLHVFNQLVKEETGFFKAEEKEYLDSVFDELKVIWDSAEDHRELVVGIASTNESLFSYQINETIRILTVFSVLMLPMTLIASIYGMNVQLPWQDQPGVVFALLGGVLIIEFLIYLGLKKFRK